MIGGTQQGPFSHDKMIVIESNIVCKINIRPSVKNWAGDWDYELMTVNLTDFYSGNG